MVGRPKGAAARRQALDDGGGSVEPNRVRPGRLLVSRRVGREVGDGRDSRGGDPERGGVPGHVLGAARLRAGQGVLKPVHPPDGGIQDSAGEIGGVQAHGDTRFVPAVRVGAGRDHRGGGWRHAVRVDGEVARLRPRRPVGRHVHDPPHVRHRVFHGHGRGAAAIQVEGIPDLVVVPEQVGDFAHLHAVAAVRAIHREQHERPVVLGQA